MAKKKKRDYGSGSVFLRGNIYYLMTHTNGKRKLLSLRTSDKEKANKAANEFKQTLAAKTKEQVAVHVAEARKLTRNKSIKIVDVWKLYLEKPTRPKSSPGTLGNYERHFKRFADWIASKYPAVTKMSGIDKNMAQEYTKNLWASGISANTFNYHLQSLKLVFRILSEDAGLESSPWVGILREPEQRKDEKKRLAFTVDEVDSIFKVLDDDNLKVLNQRQMKTLCMIGAFSGVRLIDAALLRWDSVDIKRGTIRLTPQKTRRTQRVVNIPILPALKAELQEAESWKNDSGYVIPIVADRYKRNSDGIVKDIQKIIEHAGLDMERTLPEGVQYQRTPCLYGFHSFRHYFATRAADAGCPVAVLAEILGDNIGTLQKYYVHVVAESRDKLTAALGAAHPTEKQDIKFSKEEKLKAQINLLFADLKEAELLEVLKFTESLKKRLAQLPVKE